jgi:glycosyltransferase involved in cell wall biosynthesis
MPQQSVQFVVFLCSYNGEAFILDQIRSIAEQTVGPIQLFISDDGSTDKTLTLIEQAKIDYPQLNIQLMQGPRRGFQYNFMTVFDKLAPQAPYLAFADQDDLWEPNKLERAKEILEKHPEGTPALYGGRTQLVDVKNHPIGYSPLFKKIPSFQNALVQCVCGGATMVMNQSAWKLIQASPVSTLVSHDWWFYQLITAVGGTVIYDPLPTVRYRQHGQNIMGANTSWKARIVRIKMLMQNRFRDWNDINIASLAPYASNFTPENQMIFAQFVEGRKSILPMRLFKLIHSGIYRQTLLGNMGLWVAAILGKC